MSDQPHLTTAYTPQALEELLAGEWNTIAINAEMLARICPLCNAMVPIDQRGFRYKEHHTKFHVDAMRREQERR